MHHHRLPEELSVVDMHKAILKLKKCDFLRNSYLGYKKEDTTGSYPTGVTLTNDGSKGLIGGSLLETSDSSGTVNVKPEPMETEDSMNNMDTELSNQGMTSTVGSVASSFNLGVETLDESSNETKSLSRWQNLGDKARTERAKSLSRTSSLASMTDLETLVPEFEIPPLMQDD